MSKNSLKAAISRNMAAESLEPSQSSSTKKPIPKTAKPKAKARSRANTVLIGGHFPPEVKQQLRLIAAEEGMTNQALLEEALDLLFAKKGKSSISTIV